MTLTVLYRFLFIFNVHSKLFTVLESDNNTILFYSLLYHTVEFYFILFHCFDKIIYSILIHSTLLLLCSIVVRSTFCLFSCFMPMNCVLFYFNPFCIGLYFICSMLLYSILLLHSIIFYLNLSYATLCYSNLCSFLFSFTSSSLFCTAQFCNCYTILP